LPTHRIARRLPPDAIAIFDRHCRDTFEVEEFLEANRFLAAMATRGRGALGVALSGDPRFRILKCKTSVNLAAAMPHLPAVVRGLEVSMLHALLFDAIWGITAEAVRAGGNLEYTIDAPGTLAEVTSGRAAGAFLMNPPTADDIERVSLAGATMPEK